MQRQDARAEGALPAEFGKLAQQMQTVFEFVDESTGDGKLSLLDIPIDGIPAVGFCFIA